MIYDPELNIRLGCAHLNYLVKTFGDDLTTVMVAYNTGEGNVKRNWLSNASISNDGRTIRYDYIPEQPDEIKKVKEYVRVVNKNYGIYQKQFYSDSSPGRPSGSTDPSDL